MRVALMATCLVDGLFPDVGRAVIRLLDRLGVDLEFPSGQSCCGQMHVNTGYARSAVPLVQRYAEVFASFDAVVTPSGSCAAAVRHQHVLLAERFANPQLAVRAREVAARTYELSEFLVDVLGVVDVGARFPHRVVYHPTCHSLRLLRLGDRPSRLLRAVSELELVDMPDADSCCGFGGTFAIKNPDVSAAMLADKTRAVVSTGAELCTAGDASCLMHLGGGLERQRATVRTVHIAEILAST